MMAVALSTAIGIRAEGITFATTSRLADGHWARVEISETGMHLITDATLRNLGFSDPQKVHVFGMGGALLPEALYTGMTDDMPLVPSVHNGKGIVFFGRDHIRWRQNGDSYSHSQNPYSEKSYYYLSDIAVDEPATVSLASGGGSAVTTFTTRVAHDLDQAHLGESGRNYVGEDFRSTPSQTITLSLPGNAAGEARLTTRFAAKVSGGTSWLSYQIDGNAAVGARGDSISSCPTDDYAVLSTATRKISVSGEKAEVNIRYGYSGVIFLARLDWLECFYTRRLNLDKGELHFYGKWNAGTELQIAGADASTVIWDITDPMNPKMVKATLSGSNATLRIPSDGYYEFVAFQPAKVTRAATGGLRVANQNLHAMPSPDMLIISPSTYTEGAEVIRDWHENHDSLTVTVLDPQLIYNEFSGGKPDVTAFRRLMKMWHDREGRIRYCLIMGKPSFDFKGTTASVTNAGYTPMLIWQSETGMSETSSFSNDDYIGMLDDQTEAEFDLSRSTIHVAVGRLPVTTSENAVEVANKIVNSAAEPAYGGWRNKIMLIADDGDRNDHLNQSQAVYSALRAHGNGANYLYDRVYLDSYPLVSTPQGNTYPGATEKMISNFNEGVAYTNYIGHASSTSWGHEHLWTWPQIQAQRNDNLGFMYTATCRFTPWDEPATSGGELLMLSTEGGVWGMITASRTVYISSNGTLNQYIANQWFEPGADGVQRRLGDVYIAGKNSYRGDTNKLRYVFMGDPAMRLNGISHSVKVDSIAGIAAGSEMPEIAAGSRLRVSGHLEDMKGNLLRNFNGTVAVQLYDAETVVKTNGNNDGIETVYNDRKLRLCNVNTVVQNGRWDVTLTVPLEITGNYKPALLNLYAWDGKGREANGYSEDLYVYGWSDGEITDTEGPKIEYFRLNREDFKDGDVVGPNPIVFAKLTDPSGINVSDAGVGHKLTLRLDNDTPIGDAPQYFTTDALDSNTGVLVYPLSDVTPGRHTLTIEAWDNLNNCTRDTLSFGVSASADPYIVNVRTDVNPATTGVNFIVDLDQPNTEMTCAIYVYDLNGRIMWETSNKSRTDMDSSMKTYWNLTGKGGARVPRGIYLYKARVETTTGTWSSKTGKLAVSGQ